MTKKQIIGRGATIDNSITQIQKRFFITNSEEEGDNGNLFESVIDNNHFLLNQPMLAPIPSKILSPLHDISGANTSLLLETFHNSEDKEDFLKSSNKVQGDYTKDQPRSLYQLCT